MFLTIPVSVGILNARPLVAKVVAYKILLMQLCLSSHTAFNWKPFIQQYM